jgi:hypothetical protein
MHFISMLVVAANPAHPVTARLQFLVAPSPTTAPPQSGGEPPLLSRLNLRMTLAQEIRSVQNS